MASQKAYVFIPDDPRLRAHAFQIADARRHVLRPPADQADDDAVAALERDLAEVARAEELPEQLSLFSVLSAVATGMSVHAITEQGLTLFDDEPDVPEPMSADDPQFNIDLPDVPTDAGFSLTGAKSVAEIKEELRERNLDIAKRLIAVTGMGHAKLNGELNRLAGVVSVGGATNDQLERRARHGEAWLQRLRR